MSALARGEVETLLAARGAEDGQSHSASQLDSRDADAAAGAMNQDRLRSVSLRRVKERMVRSPIRDPNARALAEAGFFGKPVNLAFESDSVFGISAGDGFRNVDAISWLYFYHPGADRLNGASAIRAGRIRQWWLDGIGAVTHVRIVGVYAYAVDADQNLPGGGLGCGDFFELQDFGTAEFVYDDCFHFWPPIFGKLDLMAPAIIARVLEYEILAEERHGVPCLHETKTRLRLHESFRSDRRRAHAAILSPFRADRRIGPRRLFASCLCPFSGESRAAAFDSNRQPGRGCMVRTCDAAR